jgi:release factor glutamine methyltransferase
MSAIGEYHPVQEESTRMHLRARRILWSHLSHSAPYDVRFQGLDLRVWPNVFSPTSTPSTTALAEQLVIDASDRVLDVGTGSGALALMAAQRTSRMVIATDISSDAVSCARENVDALSASVEVRRSNLFEAIREDERFTLIIFNPPFVDAEPVSMLERSVFDRDHAILDRFLREAPSHLARGGRIVTIFGGVEDELALSRLARRHRYDTRILRAVDLDDVHLVVYELRCR